MPAVPLPHRWPQPAGLRSSPLISTSFPSTTWPRMLQALKHMLHCEGSHTPSSSAGAAASDALPSPCGAHPTSAPVAPIAAAAAPPLTKLRRVMPPGAAILERFSIGFLLLVR